MGAPAPEATPRRPGPGPDGGGAASTHPSGGPSGGGYDYDGGARFDPEDVFAHFFGGTFGAGATWRLRGEDVGHALAVSLEDLCPAPGVPVTDGDEGAIHW